MVILKFSPTIGVCRRLSRLFLNPIPALTILLFTGNSVCWAQDSQLADTVFINGTVYTIDEKRTIREAVAIKGNKILFAGKEKEIVAYVGNSTRIIDMKGGVLLPGFTDAHTHPIQGGFALTRLSFEDIDDAKIIQQKLATYAKSHPELKVIFGIGWSLNQFKDGNPHKRILDAVVSDRPVVLIDSNGHSAWANSIALEKAGINRNTPTPTNGYIERDPQLQEATGTLRESAQELVLKLLPEPTLQEQVDQLRAGLEYQNALGYTALIDASIGAGNEQNAYLVLADQKELTARTLLALRSGESLLKTDVAQNEITQTVNQLSERRDTIERRSQGLLSGNMVKVFVDGGLESCTAAFLQNYADSGCGSSHLGEINMPENVIQEYVTALDKAGFQVHFHTIGDRAARVALDSIDSAQTTNRTIDRRHTLSHLQFAHEQDFPRFKQLNVYANIQALWAFPYDDSMASFIGSEIGNGIYPFRSLRDAGSTLVYGSDWPVSTANPFHATEVAVLRKDPSKLTGQVLLPNETLTVDDMITALTNGGARIMHQESIRGSIEVGKLADLVLLNQDPYHSKPTDLSEITIELTMFDGRVVHP